MQVPPKIREAALKSGLFQNIIHKFRSPVVKMPPKQKAARPAQENISLGPSVREGELVFGGTEPLESLIIDLEY
jgi:hypothetical protein